MGKINLKKIKNFKQNNSFLTSEEKHFLTKGTLVDKINVHSLLCIKNSNSENFKNLLSFTKNRRNEVILLVMKNLTGILGDLKEEIGNFEYFLKTKIINAFCINSSNFHVGEQVLKLVENLIDMEIYEEEMFQLLLKSKKRKNSNFIKEKLKEEKYQEFLIENLEDSYYKHDTYNGQLSVLKTLEGVKSKLLFDFYNSAVISDEYSLTEKITLLNQIIKGLVLNFQPGVDINNADFIKNSIGKGLVDKDLSKMLVTNGLELLSKMGDSDIKNVMLRSLRFKIIEESNFVKILRSLDKKIKKELLPDLISFIFPYSPEFISSFLLEYDKCKFKEVNWLLFIMKDHWHPTVRYLATKMINRESFIEMDPFDKVMFELSYY